MKNSFVSKKKLSTIEILSYKALINSDIRHDEFVLVNDELEKYKDMTEAIENPKSINLDNI